MCRRSAGVFAGSIRSGDTQGFCEEFVSGTRVTSQERGTTMWMKTRFAQWEVEGQVRERVNNALATSQQGRLAREARGDQGRYVLATIWAKLAQTPAQVVQLLSLRGDPTGAQRHIDGGKAELSPSRTAGRASPGSASTPVHR